MIARVDVLGVGVSVVNLDTAAAEMRRWIDEGEQHYVCVSGVHGVMESQRDAALRNIHNGSGLTTPDGMPLVWSARLAGARAVSRVYGPDLMLKIAEQSAGDGTRWFFYGGKEGVAAQLAQRLTERYPGLQVVGHHAPPFRELTTDEDQAVVRAINEARPDIVWVGLSTPKQERWMAAHVGRLQAPVLVGVGAAFDIHAGTLRQAPRWIQRSGMEWLFRLLMEPRRLWRRYLTNNPMFVVRILRQRPRLIVPPLVGDHRTRGIRRSRPHRGPRKRDTERPPSHTR